MEAVRSASVLLLVALFHLAAGGVSADGNSDGDAAVPVAMKRYTINLDLPPEERWLELLSEYKSSVPLIIQYFNQSVSASNVEFLQ